jgi:hypothetical protein
MAAVSFRVRHEFDAPPRVLWDELVDWKAHEAWIPMTRVDAEPGDSTAVGYEFTAFTGPRPVALKDTMRVAECHWDDTADGGRCVVTKLGPVLSGQAGFTVSPNGDGSAIEWFEEVDVKYLPRLFAPVVTKLSAAGFRFGMRRLDGVLRDRVAT